MGTFRDGVLKEREFAADLVKKYGGSCRFASEMEDIYGHIDIWWHAPNGGRFGFDVKGARKNRRTDKRVDYSIQWIETQNVNGRKGWLYGKEDYVAFEGERDWIVVALPALQQLIKDIGADENHIVRSNPKLYQYYQRSGRKDIIIKVATIDLMNVARILIPRDLCANIITK